MRYRKKPVVIEAIQNKGIKGEFYTCKPDIFEGSYEEV